MWEYAKRKKVKITVVFSEIKTVNCSCRVIEGIFSDIVNGDFLIDNKYLINPKYISILEIME